MIILTQTCAQYLRTNESSILEAVGLTSNSEGIEPFPESNMPTGQNYPAAVKPISSHVVAGQHFAYVGGQNKRRASDAL